MGPATPGRTAPAGVGLSDPLQYRGELHCRETRRRIEFMQHALASGVVGVACLYCRGLSSTWNQGLGSHWYPLALIVLAMPCAWAGGKLYMVLRHAAAQIQNCPLKETHAMQKITPFLWSPDGQAEEAAKSLHVHLQRIRKSSRLLPCLRLFNWPDRSLWR